jgi:hypothetical protein
MTKASVLDHSAVADAADSLRVQIDLLLDRSAQRVLNSPAAGSSAWHAAWRDRESPAGRQHAREHLLARIAIASHLGLGVQEDVRAARIAGVLEGEITIALAGRRPRSARRSARNSTIEDQLSLFP